PGRALDPAQRTVEQADEFGLPTEPPPISPTTRRGGRGESVEKLVAGQRAADGTSEAPLDVPSGIGAWFRRQDVASDFLARGPPSHRPAQAVSLLEAAIPRHNFTPGPGQTQRVALGRQAALGSSAPTTEDLSGPAAPI